TLGPPNWIHIVVVGNSSTNGAGGLKVYVDGTFIPPGGNNDFGSTLDEDFSEWDATGRTLPIGHWNWGARDNHYTGNIDEFIIFNKTLNDTEVSEIYNNVYLIK
ncbi:MAG: hypothetical protein IH845_05855, partial [Nanoarchaeota archaeon]|nr:hypothetical protein [Nanoarchaeota archaeon]